jgi:hypothetical protein
MKRIFCLLICLVMMLGLLPAVAGAASAIDEVSISALEHPIAGQELDFSYKLPTRGISYQKDKDFDEVTWIDMGKDGEGNGKQLKSGALAEEGHNYIAELHLIADKGESFQVTKNGAADVDVELTEEMDFRVMDIETTVFSSEGTSDALIIRLHYRADYCYDRKHPVELSVDEDLYAGGSVTAGERPWTESDFGGFPRDHFDLTVTWYVGRQTNARNQMNWSDEFESGQTYTLKVELDSSRTTRHAYFDPDTDILINEEEGETWVDDEYGFSAYAIFRFTAGTGIDKVTIKGIEEPVVGEARQRSGFTCTTDGVDVEFNKWEYETEGGSVRPFNKGNFEAGNAYLLSLDLIPDPGYTLSLTKKNISVNKGTVDSISFDDDICTVVIRFDVGELELTGIEVTTPPRNTEYYVGERFSTKGMVVTATYSDGHTEKVTDYEFGPTATLDKDDTVITIKYTEGKITKETELNITVIDEHLTLTAIVITTKPKKTAYKTGETFDPKGMVVTAVYDDKSTAQVTNLEFDPAGKLTLDDDEITISYSEGRKTFTDTVSIRVTQAEKILKDLVLTRDPVKTTYYEGEYFDPEGMVITAVYEDESTEELKSSDYTISPRTALSKGNEVVVITYVEKNVAKSVAVDVKVKEVERKLSELRITTEPDKTVYMEDETFDPTGMVIVAIYDDKTTAEVKKFEVKPAGKLTKDTASVEISYTEMGITKTVRQPVTVKPVLVNPFRDVKESDYYYDAVLWAFYHDPQVTNGMTDTEFSPTVTCTRGQVVTFLWRAAGEPAPRAKQNPFKDVSEDSWYRDAVLWAVEKGITNGTGADTFSPEKTCSLAHVITFLYRAAGEPGKSAEPETWYADAMNWAFDIGLFKNLAFSDIRPTAECPRRDIVNFLYLQLAE